MSMNAPVKWKTWLCTRRIVLSATMVAAASFVPLFSTPLAASAAHGVPAPASSAGSALSDHALLQQACSSASAFLDIAGQGSLCQAPQGWMMQLRDGHRIQVAPPDLSAAVLKNTKPYAAAAATPAGSAVAASTSVLASQCVAAPQQRIELVYAHFQGAADNFAAQAPDIQAQFAAVDASYMNYDGQHFFGVGVHLTVECDNSNQPIVHDVALSTPIGSANFNTIVSDLETAGYCRAGFGQPSSCTVSGSVHYWVYTDGNPDAALGYAGQSSIIGDDSTGSANQINQTDEYSINYGYCLNPAAGTSACNAPIDQQGPGYGPQIFAHENGHAMGAVQLSAPDSTGGWHCTDGLDVMCYNDGGSNGNSYSGSVCADAPNGTAPFDCNFNDYFNPGPAAGSYLATHWDVASANNKWLLIQPAATNTVLQASASSVPVGQPVTFTATTGGSATPHPGVPTGTVTFADGPTALGSAAVNSTGQSTFTTQSLSSGSHSITATFSGSGVYSGSSSASVAVQVGMSSSQTLLATSQNPSPTTSSVTVTATVTTVPAGAGTPSGGVTFYDGTTSLGTASLGSAGSASMILVGLSAGTHALQATYAGNSNLAASSSSVLQQTVLLPSLTLLSSSAANQISARGSTLTFSAAVQSIPVSQGSPTGTVTFQDGGTTLATVGLAGTGPATFSTASLTLGTHTITATYNGDASHTPSSAAIPVVIATWTLGRNLQTGPGWMSPMGRGAPSQPVRPHFTWLLSLDLSR